LKQICRITILAENTVYSRALLAEHGLAYWIEYGSHSLLFDTGQGEVILNNAQELGVDLKQTEAVVLSHGHYDHTGGLEKVLRVANQPKVYIHPEAFQPKFSCRTDGPALQIGMSNQTESSVRKLRDKLIWTAEPTKIISGLWVTGSIPRDTAFEDTTGPYFRDVNCQQPDLLRDDQALFFESTRGVVVLFGCAHAGVINTLQYIRKLTGHKKIHAVIGGMHLINASCERIGCTIESLQEMEVERLGPAHCTGPRAAAMLESAFPGKYFLCSVGMRAEFEII